MARPNVANTLELSPDQARQACRIDRTMERFTTSSSFSLGYVQTNVAIVTSGVADDLAEFCRLNSVSCPLLYRSQPGEVNAGPLARNSDIRTDLNRYVINKQSKDGIQETSSAWELVDYPWGDMVTFYTGCSYSFQNALIKAGVPIQNVNRGVDCSIFTTNIECISVGRMSCPGMAVSMRPIRKELIQKTVSITARYDAVHGAPVHIGDPSIIGIRDILKPEFADPANFDDDQLVPVFWGCGHTSAEAVRLANLDISFSHSVPGILFITDVRTDDYFKDHPPAHGSEQPVVIPLQDDPYYASILGQTTLTNINQLEEIISSDLSSVQTSGGLVKAALRVSHAQSVAIVTSCHGECSGEELLAAVILVKAVQFLDKKVTLFVSDGDVGLLKDIVQNCVKAEVLQNDIDINDIAKEQGKQSFDVVVHVGKTDELMQGRSSTIIISCNATQDKSGTSNLIDQANQNVQNDGNSCCMTSSANHMIAASVPMYGSMAVAIAVFMLQNCLIHSRYRRHGVGLHQPVKISPITEVVQQIDTMMRLLASRDIHLLDKTDAKIKYQKKLEHMLSVFKI